MTPAPAVLAITSSGSVPPIAIGESIVLVEVDRYRFKKLFHADGTVVSQKINIKDRPFNCGYLHFPHATHQLMLTCQLPIASVRSRNPIIFYLIELISVLKSISMLDDRCLVMTDFSSVDRLQRAFENGKVGAQTYFDPNAQLLTELTENQQKETE